MKDKTKDRIKNIMSAVFEVPVEEINEDSLIIPLSKSLTTNLIFFGHAVRPA